MNGISDLIKRVLICIYTVVIYMGKNLKKNNMYEFSSVQSLSRVRLFVTP